MHPDFRWDGGSGWYAVGIPPAHNLAGIRLRLEQEKRTAIRPPKER